MGEAETVQRGASPADAAEEGEVRVDADAIDARADGLGSSEKKKKKKHRKEKERRSSRSRKRRNQSSSRSRSRSRERHHSSKRSRSHSRRRSRSPSPSRRGREPERPPVREERRSSPEHGRHPAAAADAEVIAEGRVHGGRGPSREASGTQQAVGGDVSLPNELQTPAPSVAGNEGPSKSPRPAKEKSTGAPKAVLLSFGDEMEELDAVTRTESVASISEVTAKRFKKPAPSGGSPAGAVPALQASGGLTPLKPAPISGEAVHLRFGEKHEQGPRAYMEDRHVAIASFPLAAAPPDGCQRAFFAVYDGHNGAKAADIAAARMHVVLGAQVPLRSVDGAASDRAKVDEAFKETFRIVDTEILNTTAAEKTRDGSTALCLLRVGGAIFPAHTGDSRAVALVGGRALRLTKDHKPELPEERRRVEALGGRIEFQGCWRVVADPPPGSRMKAALAVARSLGDLDFKVPRKLVSAIPDVGMLELTPSVSLVVLASDGLWDVLSDQDACDIAAKALEEHGKGRGGAAGAGVDGFSAGPQGPDPAAVHAASVLVRTALERKTQDNVTALVIVPAWSGA